MVLIIQMEKRLKVNLRQGREEESVVDQSAIHLLNGFPSLPSPFVTANAVVAHFSDKRCLCVCLCVCRYVCM